MAMDKYQGAGSVLFDRDLLAEAQSVRVGVKSNSNAVRTMRKGLAGRSRGPVTTEISIENAVPRAGLEKTFVEKCVQDADVSIVVYFGNKRYQWDGWIDSVDASMATDSAAQLSFSVMAGPPTIT